ncbi:MAG TPA: glycosyltransferase family 39 protein, partial [Vicinamibacterales bacterium]|nr:glycosyltransferase family 39 protein [Vicinamibacterales bacterium]
MTENRRVEALLFALALAPRLLYLAIARSPFENYNWNLAGSLLTDGSLSIGGVKTTAFEPLYPLFLAASRFVTGDRWVGVQAIQCALGAAGAVLLYRLAVTLTGRPRVGIAAATLYAIYPLMVRYAVNISDATLMTVLVLAFALEFTGVETRARAARAGAWLGLMMLTRAMTLPLVCSSVLLWRAGRRQGAAVFTATALLVAAPYGLRNYALNGWMLPTRGGLNLFLSNCLYTARLMPDFGLDLLEDYAHQMLERRVPAVGVPSPRLERMEDEVYTRLALEHMESDPAGTIRMRLLSLWYFFSPTLVPYHDPTVD